MSDNGTVTPAHLKSDRGALKVNTVQPVWTKESTATILQAFQDQVLITVGGAGFTAFALLQGNKYAYRKPLMKPIQGAARAPTCRYCKYESLSLF